MLLLQEPLLLQSLNKKRKIIIYSILALGFCDSLVSERDNVVDDTNTAVGMTFSNGGNFFSENSIELKNITPSDKIEFDINLYNNSNVTINYRTLLSYHYGTGLFDDLVIRINNEAYDGVTRRSSYKNIIPKREQILFM